ncbi:hypothetical protein GGR57DRAFT_444744 [Xylariaceae sp. FL1272]|nr:hypothetical protein GGR57DRAFT_444744 [Xylariaceae sp. FL1272]
MGAPNTENEWQDYIQSMSLSHCFEPLRGTERERYGSIIDEAHELECRARSKERDAEHNLRQALHVILDMELYFEKLPNSRRGRGRPRKDAPPMRNEVEQDRGMIREGIARLEKQSERREDCPARHLGHHFECIRSTYNTKFGILKAINYAYVRPDLWYMNHRPGDPIVRIQAKRHLQASQNDIGPQELHEVVLEGIVPFSGDELKKRFTRYSFHSFTSMAVAFVSFKPETSGSTPWMPLELASLASLESLESLEHLTRTEFEDIQGNERFVFMSSLLVLWRDKYGYESILYPSFVKRQIRESMTKFREIGWLMCKLEEKDWELTRSTFWFLCKILLKVMTGEEAVSLAQAHVQLTLDAEETSEKLEDEDTDHFLIYCQSSKQRHAEKV